MSDNKTKAIKKAKKTSKYNKKGEIRKKSKTHTKIRFFKPKTQTLARNPKYVRSTS
jgi:hypothetical protein